MYAKFMGTTDWHQYMHSKESDPVLATVEYEDGSRECLIMQLRDGEWFKPRSYKEYHAVAWMPLPKPYEGSVEGFTYR